MKMDNSFFSRSARSGPTPFKYSIGLDSIVELVTMGIIYEAFIKIASCKIVCYKRQLQRLTPCYGCVFLMGVRRWIVWPFFARLLR